jgi:hypothetical protein
MNGPVVKEPTSPSRDGRCIPLLDVFDFPERFGSVGERNTTTSPTQSLFMINGDWMLGRAKKLAERLVQEAPGGEDSRVRLAYRLAVARDASVAELERAVNFIYERRGDAKVDRAKASSISATCS